ncbi:MAG: class I SAM-dependent methyltransferase [Acetatifactor sp.]|nr:class I SAM-dependent methyltransferase [Acetatifactor sp.]
MADLYDFPDIYDERFTDKANEVYRSHYQKMFEGKGIQSVLDCSIGTGCLTFCLAELGYHVSGSDLSASMLEKAKEKAALKGLPVQLTQCDFRELSRHFAQTFDCVMSTGNAFAHVSNSDIERTLREMDHLVRSGGCLYLDSRNWDRELENKKRFRWGQPFIRQDGVRINYVQDWDYHENGSVTIHILQGYERDGKIFETMEFEEHLNPFPMELIRSTLEGLGYREFTVRPLPWFCDKPFEEMDWYCVLAQK